jgi:BirA family biotin operon repressor/biotin-[acetyl-CoA-carboxylase] ligase
MTGSGLGSPRLHLRTTDSTNARARELAARGAPHGTLVTASEQTAGRGRQGRTWSAPAGKAILASLVLRRHTRVLPLAAGVAVAEVCGGGAQIKWPNDVLLDGRKVAGILVEGRPQEGWAVLGIGLNVAVSIDDLPAELRDRATGLGRRAEDVEPVLGELLAALERWVPAPEERVLAAVRERDALLGRAVTWAGGTGTGAGLDGDGRLIVETAGGERVVLDAGEVHLGRLPG